MTRAIVGIHHGFDFDNATRMVGMVDAKIGAHVGVTGAGDLTFEFCNGGEYLR